MSRTIGLSHFAIPVTDLERSAAFYKKYGELDNVKRWDPDVVWLSDRLRPFHLVLLLVDKVDQPLKKPGHIGFICDSPGRVDELAALAKEEGCLADAPRDYGEKDSGGYHGLLFDPDGHSVEISHHQAAFYRPQWTPYFNEQEHCD